MSTAARRTITPSPEVVAKARRLLREAKVARLAVRPGAEVYEVEGDTDTWRVIVEGDAARCDCLVRRGPCSHIVAVALLDHVRGRR